MGKGTMVQGLSDVDLVAFINPPHLKPIHRYDAPQNYRDRLQNIIADLKRAILQMESVRIKKVDAYLVNFEIYVGARVVEVDLLPTADNFGGASGKVHSLSEIVV